MSDPGAQIETLRDRIEASDKISDTDRSALFDFSDELYLLQTKYSDHRHLKLLRHCTRMAEHVGGLAEALEDRDATEDIVRWINRTYDNEETNRDYRVALSVFGRRTTDENGDDPPESIEWVPSGTSSNYDPAPNPGDMLHWEADVLPMIEATRYSRDAALIATAWDSGARSGEIRGLSVGDVTDHRHGYQLTFQGKTGQRTVTLIPSVPYLQQWLSDHPARDDPNAPLWCKLDRPEEFSYRMFTKILEGAADKADIDKPVTFTNFRKSSASYLASQGMNQAHIEDHHGWVRGSDVASRYVSVFGQDADRELAKVHGVELDDDEEPEPIAPMECPRCGRDTPREKDFCVWCDQATSHDAVQDIKAEEQDLRDSILTLIREDPELLNDIERAQDAMTVFEERPDLFEDAKRFREALGGN
ncbi:tyrosine-type recombinase/integrase [Haloplanus halobius]|uniref:tyrosine-type recombinase/integrase n=1 Tax=Haloplanus halobius TaxID=2934938 RepID=UPI00200CA750|nr:tyrosine-type recombinase/integrase [Haloplanus sp. XH21]